MPKKIVYHSLPSCVACRWCSENTNFTIFVDWDEHTYEILNRLSKNCPEFGQSKQCLYLMNHFVSIRGIHFYLLIFHLFPNSKKNPHFRLSATQLRVVFVKEKSTQPEKHINILRNMDAIFFCHQFWKKRYSSLVFYT